MRHMTAAQRTADAALRRAHGINLDEWLRAQRASGATYGGMEQRLADLGVFTSHESLRRWTEALDLEASA